VIAIVSLAPTVGPPTPVTRTVPDTVMVVRKDRLDSKIISYFLYVCESDDIKTYSTSWVLVFGPVHR
jgi:hypothetical protein